MKTIWIFFDTETSTGIVNSWIVYPVTLCLLDRTNLNFEETWLIGAKSLNDGILGILDIDNNFQKCSFVQFYIVLNTLPPILGEIDKLENCVKENIKIHLYCNSSICRQKIINPIHSSAACFFGRKTLKECFHALFTK